MRTIYFDCFAGASGDMIVGALLDAGLDAEALKSQLAGLGLDGYEIAVERVRRSQIAATKFNVNVRLDKQPHRHLSHVAEIIGRAPLSDLTKGRALRAFELLAEAEARVHGTTKERVHFHEVGAVDAIVDVVGAMLGFEMLGAERFLASPLRVGKGFVDVEHGRMPIPAPGTAELLRGVPVYAGDLDGEFVTPTGAAILVSLCERFAPLPPFAIERIGYGAGTRDPKDFPNALRLLIGEEAGEGEGRAPGGEAERVVVIETNIDDMNPQAYAMVMERAFRAGALDVFLTPAQMKKDRPGVLLTALAEPRLRDAVIDVLLEETTTLGVRFCEMSRRVLERTVETVATAYGPVRVKVARRGERTLHFQPEYEDCARLAAETGVSLIEVQAAAVAAYRQTDGEREQRSAGR